MRQQGVFNDNGTPHFSKRTSHATIYKGNNESASYVEIESPLVYITIDETKLICKSMKRIIHKKQRPTVMRRYHQENQRLVFWRSEDLLSPVFNESDVLLNLKLIETCSCTQTRKGTFAYTKLLLHLLLLYTRQRQYKHRFLI